LVFGFGGVEGVFIIAGAVMLLAALVIVLRVRVELPKQG
jgi:hypothetical protein